MLMDKPTEPALFKCEKCGCEEMIVQRVVHVELFYDQEYKPGEGMKEGRFSPLPIPMIKLICAKCGVEYKTNKKWSSRELKDA